MMKKILIFVLITFLFGCQSIEQRNALNVSKSTDKEITSAFFPKFSKSYNLRVNPNSLEFKNYIKTGESFLKTAIAQHMYRDPLQDPVLIQYLKVANNRSNHVKSYSAKINRKILKLFRQSLVSGRVNRFDIDSAYVEYNQQGKMISTLVRYHQYSQPLATVLEEEFIKIYFGNLTRIIQMKITPKYFESELIAEVK